MTVDRTPPGGGTTARQRSDLKNKYWRVWLGIAIVLLALVSWRVGVIVSTSISDARFVSSLRDDDPQGWLLNMSDAQLATSGREECSSMEEGASPQSRIDFYTDFNGAYLVNDAMRYLCPDQLNR